MVIFLFLHLLHRIKPLYIKIKHSKTIHLPILFFFVNVQVTIACDAVLNAPSAYKKQEPESWEEEIQVSRHARSLRQLNNGVRIPPR